MLTVFLHTYHSLAGGDVIVVRDAGAVRLTGTQLTVEAMVQGITLTLRRVIICGETNIEGQYY